MNNIMGRMITLTIALFLGLISALPVTYAQNYWDSYYYNYNYGYNSNYYGGNSYYQQPVNQPPVFLPIASQYTRVNQYLSFTISAYDPDGNQPVTYSAVSLPSGASFNPSSRTFSWTPTTAGVYTAVFRAFDCATCYSELEVRIIVDQPVVVPPTSYPPTYYPPTTCGIYGYPTCTNPNPYPVCAPVIFSGTPVNTAREGQLYTYTVTASSGVLSPYTNPRALTFRVIDGPQGLTINSSLGTILWVPNFSQGGTSYTVKIGASNGCTENVLSYIINVEDVQITTLPPAVTTITKKEVIVNKPLCETQKVEKKEICVPVTITTQGGNTIMTTNNPTPQTQTSNPAPVKTNSIADAFVSFFNSLFASPLLLLVCLILLFLLVSERRKYESLESWNRIERNYERLQKEKNKASEDLDLPRP